MTDAVVCSARGAVVVDEGRESCFKLRDLSKYGDARIHRTRNSFGHLIGELRRSQLSLATASLSMDSVHYHISSLLLRSFEKIKRDAVMESATSTSDLERTPRNKGAIEDVTKTYLDAIHREAQYRTQRHSGGQ